MYQENEYKVSGGGGSGVIRLILLNCNQHGVIYIRHYDDILLCCITNNYFFFIQVGLDIFARFNRDVEPMWACNLHEYYTDFKSRVQNVFRKYKVRAKLIFE